MCLELSSELISDTDAMWCICEQQGLGICIHSNEFDPCHTGLNHTVHYIAATIANADHADPGYA